MGNLKCKCVCQESLYINQVVTEMNSPVCKVSHPITFSKKKTPASVSKITAIARGYLYRMKFKSRCLFEIDKALREQYEYITQDSCKLQQKVKDITSVWNIQLDFSSILPSERGVKLAVKAYLLNQGNDEILYFGNFNLKGKFNGSGILFKDGCLYKGSFRDGLLQGEGLIISDDGYYQGKCCDSKKQGQGLLTTQQETYDGIWENDSYIKNRETNESQENIFDLLTGRQSHRVVNYLSGSYYEGSFEGKHFHGKGKFVWSSTTRYEGDYVDGKKQGFGKYISDNFVYEGKFWKGMYNGDGKIVVDCKQYITSFRFNKLLKSEPFLADKEVRLPLIENNLATPDQSPAITKSKIRNKSSNQIECLLLKSAANRHSRHSSMSLSKSNISERSKRSLFSKKYSFKIVDDRSEQIGDIVEERNRLLALGRVSETRKNSCVNEDEGVIEFSDNLSFN